MERGCTAKGDKQGVSELLGTIGTFDPTSQEADDFEKD